jgi:hypothetical protein
MPTRVTLYRDPLGAQVANRTWVDDVDAHLAALQAAAEPTRLTTVRRGDEVIVYPTPEDPVTAIAIGVTVLSLGFAVYQYLTAPEAVKPSEVDGTSPNNQLGTRANRLRPQARVPDVYGKLRVVPDLVAVPYRTYVDHRQVETILACVGRGTYTVGKLREGDVPLEDLEGYGADVYAPGTWPGSGSPQFTFGTPPTDGVMKVTQATVPEDELLPPNAAFFQGSGNVRLVYPNRVETSDGGAGWDDLFPVGTVVNMSGLSTFDPPDPDGGGPLPDPTPFTIVGGPYEVTTVGSTFMTFVSPASVDPDWNRLDDFAGGTAPYMSILVEEDTEHWLGPVFVTNPGDRIIISVVAPDGLYRQNSDGTRDLLVLTYRVRVTPCDSSGTPIGPPTIQVFGIAGSKTERGLRGSTDVIVPPFIDSGYQQIEVRRSTDRDHDEDDVDSIYWAETYVCEDVDGPFDDVTLIHAQAMATANGRVDRFQLSAEVTRRLQSYDGTSHTGPLFATTSAASAAAAICLDPHVGGLTGAECDFDSLYDEEVIVNGWFGSTVCEFSYTFDSENMGFEDMLMTALRAGFMTAFRDGPVIKFRADLPADPTLLLNSRCVLPGSLSTRLQLGPPEGEHDGVEVRYADPETGEQLDLVIPQHDGVVRPKKLETAGVTSERIAKYHAWREWSRLRYMRESATLVATAEGQLAQVGDVVLLADLLRPGTRHGECVYGTDFLIETQRDESDAGMPATLHVQLNDGTVVSGEVFGYTSLPPYYVVFVAQGFETRLTVDPQAYARATYTLVPGDESSQAAREFEVVERSARDHDWGLELIQHTFMRFAFDRLECWLPLIAAEDWGPDGLAVADASGTYATDSGRDGSLVRSGGASPVSVTGLSLNLGSGISLAVWLKNDAAGLVIEVDDLELSVGPDGSVVLVLGASPSLEATRSVSGWSHVAFTVGGGDSALYVDGELADSGSESLSGSHVPILLDHVGRSSDLRIWRSVLAPSDVRTLAAETRVSVIA